MSSGTSQINLEQIVAFDFETHRIQPGLLAPPVVVGSICSPEVPEARLLFPAREALAELQRQLQGVGVIAGANIAYDAAVAAAADDRLLDMLFEKYRRGEVFDLLIGTALDAVAGGHLFKDPETYKPLVAWNRKKGRYMRTKRYNLDLCVQLWLGRTDAKSNSAYVERYHEFESLPVEQWPDVVRQYPIDDALNTRAVSVELVRRGQNLGVMDWPGLAERMGEKITHMTHQARAAFAMHLACVWGLRTDPESVEAFAKKVEQTHEENEKFFREVGFIRGEGVKGKKPGSEDQAAVKRAVAEAYGATGACQRCAGAAKVPSPKTGNPIVCKVYTDDAGEYHGCDGTGLDLSTAPSLVRTDAGGVSKARDTLTESDDGTLERYGKVSENNKWRNTYLPFLRQGVNMPLTLSGNVLVESGRASYDGLIQLLPRSGGIRDCFCARPGCAYCSTDYSALELCTLSQVCLWVVGWSRMAETINRTGDPGSLHTAFGARMLGIDGDEFKRRVKAGDPVAKNGRQMAKAANFGFPGLMGGAKLAIAKRKEGLRFCIAAGHAPPCPACEGVVGNRGCRRCFGRGALCGLKKVTEWGRRFKRKIPPTCEACILIAEDLRRAWLDMWPEMQDYFGWVQDHEGFRENCARMVSPGTGYVRGGMGSNAANHPFQHLASAGAKHALWKVSQACYVDRKSPLYGGRVVVFAHDEVITELPLATAHEAGLEQARIMIEAMCMFVPDVVIGCEPALMRRWYKDAEPVKDAAGRLIPWEPKPKKAGAAAEPERYAQRVTDGYTRAA